LTGCPPGPGRVTSPLATIKYHQVGACKGYQQGSKAVSVGPHAAYIVFKIETVDNTRPTVTFHFDPSRLYINQRTHHFVDTNLMFAQDLGIFGAESVPVPRGQNTPISGFSIVVVSTSIANGSAEAHQVSYNLL